ncbi:MAG TPA: MazG family protein [Candidatus Limnocylindria bacterium]|jgi:tetrapyrrole methylase family protein/MazG family protein
MSLPDLVASLLERWPGGVDIVPASRLDRHAFATGRAVVIVLDAAVDRALLAAHYPAEILAAAPEADGLLALPPRDPYADLASLGAVARIAERLRRPDGCPWDREQTHASLRPHLLEEAYEALDALDSGDPERLRDELGDLLFQIAIHAQLASEAGAFDLGDVSRAIGEKLVRRHPHVFAGTAIAGGDLLVQWEQIKRAERADAAADDAKRRSSVVDGVPRSLPALFAAERLQERAARVRLVPPRVQLPLDVDDAGFLGDVLFDLVAEARERGFDAERALRDANARFAARVGRVEARARAAGRELESYRPDELRAMWEDSDGQIPPA